eukprot:5266104-Pyramimonas_sp.AAC.1
MERSRETLRGHAGDISAAGASRFHLPFARPPRVASWGVSNLGAPAVDRPPGNRRLCSESRPGESVHLHVRSVRGAHGRPRQ